MAHPNVPLPPRFRYPDDARRQLELAREYVEQHFGVAPVGLWPSEGSVSDEVFALAAELGFEWAATDSGVLDRTQQRAVPVDGLYRPYEWRQGGTRMRLIFRDHFMSDLIGFVYSKMEPSHAAARFPAPHPPELRRHSGRAAATPWCRSFSTAKTPGNTIDHNGRPFLRELYRRISDDAGTARRHRQRGASALMAPEPLDHIFPGLLDQRQFRYLDRRRGRQPGLDAVAARARHLRRHHRRPRGAAAAWRSRNC